MPYVGPLGQSQAERGTSCSAYWFQVWLSGNALVSNAVTLHQARLVPGWVTVFGQVNHIGAEPGTEVYSAPWVGAVSTQRKLGE